MFRTLFRRTTAPVTSAANPGRGTELRIDSGGSLAIRVQAVACLAGVLRQRGVTVKERAAWLELPGGIVLLPRIVAAQRAPAGHWLTTTTIEAAHPDFFPQGIFEYQHAAGADVGQAMGRGFEQFESDDLPVLRETVSGQLRQCTGVSFERARPTLFLPHARRVVLGPVAHQVAATHVADEAHPFCPCCFFTHTTTAMEEKLRAPDFFAVRLYAARHPADGVVADCRVNGLDWEAGRQALLAYAATWPNRGFETRRQYLAIRTQP